MRTPLTPWPDHLASLLQEQPAQPAQQPPQGGQPQGEEEGQEAEAGGEADESAEGERGEEEGAEQQEEEEEESEAEDDHESPGTWAHQTAVFCGMGASVDVPEHSPAPLALISFPPGACAGGTGAWAPAPRPRELLSALAAGAPALLHRI